MKFGMAKIKDKRKIIVVVSVVLAIIIGIWALFFRNTGPKIEGNAEPTGTEEKMDQPEGGGAVNITYSNKVAIDLSDKSATLMFENPGRSNQAMSVQVIIKDNVVVESGVLKPGNKVSKLDMKDDMKLSEGKHEGKFNVLFYNSETGDQEIVNTTIPVEVSVSK